MAIGTAAAILGAGALSAGAGLLGASKASKAQESAANKAAAAQLQANKDNIAFQREVFNKQLELQKPFREGSLTAQNQLMNFLGLSGKNDRFSGMYNKNFGMADFQKDPGYDFRMSEGMKALERSAAARGGLLSGSTMKGIQRFGQDLGSQEYGNAFNRYYAERASRLNPLQSLMGIGQSSANALTGAAGQMGQNVGTAYGQLGAGLAQSYGNAGAARASGYVGGANALSGALTGGVNNYMMMNMLGGGGFGGGSTWGSPVTAGFGAGDMWG